MAAFLPHFSTFHSSHSLVGIMAAFLRDAPIFPSIQPHMGILVPFFLMLPFPIPFIQLWALW
jgi:hypothetical protein